MRRPQTMPRRPEWFGLFSIRERLLLLGGRMEVASSPQQGTRVTPRARHPLLLPRPTGEDARGLAH